MKRVTQEEIVEKLENRPVCLYNVFTFSIEDLQSNPGKYMPEIEKYLNEHSDKIERYEFHSWTDEASFRPMLMIQIYPTGQWKDMIIESNEKFNKMFIGNGDTTEN